MVENTAKIREIEILQKNTYFSEVLFSLGEKQRLFQDVSNNMHFWSVHWVFHMIFRMLIF